MLFAVILGLLADQAPPPINVDRTPRLPGAAVMSIDSRALGERRDIWVDAPPACDRGACDTLFVLDADALYPLASSYATVMRTMGRMHPVIVVGIPSRSTDDRIRNFTSSVSVADRPRYPQAGGASRFSEFLLSEVAPAVASRFGAAARRVLAGHSLAGLFAIETLARGGVHDAIAISPTLGWNGAAAVTEFERWLTSKPPSSHRLHVSVADGDNQAYRNAFEQLRRLAAAAPATLPDASFTLRANEDHVTTVAPALQQAMLRCFGK